MEPDNRKLEEYLQFIREHERYFLNTRDGLHVITGKDEILDSIKSLEEKASGKKLPARCKNTGVVYEDDYLWFLCDIVRFRNNDLNTHHRIIRKGGDITGIAILGIYNGKIILLRHFRHPARKEFIELPRGGIIEGRSPEETVVQEIGEEFGGKLKRLEKLQIIHPATSIDTATIQCYYGEYEEINSPSVNEGILEIIQMSPDELQDAIRAGVVTDAITICVFYQCILNGYIDISGAP